MSPGDLATPRLGSSPELDDQLELMEPPDQEAGEEDVGEQSSDMTDASDDRILAAFKKAWPVYRDGRKEIEQEWKKDTLDWLGEYDETTLAAIRSVPNRSEVFVKLPRSVAAAAKALILQLLFDEGEIPWDLVPTILPEIEDIDLGLMRNVVEQAIAMMPPDTPPEEKAAFEEQNDAEAAVEKVKTVAAKRAEKMRRTIKDQMQAMKFDERFMLGLDNLVVCGTMVLKGPTSVDNKPRKWHKSADGKWNVALSRELVGASKEEIKAANKDLRPQFEVLDIWSVYGDPSAQYKDALSGVIVRHIMSRHEFSRLKALGFDRDRINEVLTLHPENGNWVQQWWESTINADDNSNTTSRHQRFEVFEFHTFMSGRTLRQCGHDIDDDMLDEDVLVEMWVSGERLLKVAVSNQAPPSLPFHFIPYETVSNRIWGRSPVRQMSDSTSIYNGCQRAIMDNMAISSGYQGWVDLSRMADPGSANLTYPNRMWTLNDMTGLSQPPVGFFQPQSNVVHMQTIQKGVLLHIQKETNLPDFAMGLPTSAAHNRTAEGLAMQRNMAMAFIRSVIGNIDTFGLKPVIEELYNWNMNFNPDEDIKGDFEVVAKGVMNASADDAITQRILGLIQSPIGEEYVKLENAAPLLAKGLKVQDLDLIRSTEEVDERRARNEAVRAQAAEMTKRYSPETPKLNATLDFFHKIDPDSPLFGPAAKEAAQAIGILTDSMAAAIDAVNEIAARNMAALVSKADADALAADVQAQGDAADAAAAAAQGNAQDPASVALAKRQLPPVAFTRNEDGSVSAAPQQGA